MRLGSRQTNFRDANSKIARLYGSPKSIHERHRHRYEINSAYVPQFEEAGMQFVGVDDSNERMEIMEMNGHPYYVGVQYHPEYTSRPLRPSPPFIGLILAAKGKLQSYLDNGCQFAPISDYNSDDLNEDGSLSGSLDCSSSSGHSTDDDDAVALRQAASELNQQLAAAKLE